MRPPPSFSLVAEGPPPRDWLFIVAASLLQQTFLPSDVKSNPINAMFVLFPPPLLHNILTCSPFMIVFKVIMLFAAGFKCSHMEEPRMGEGEYHMYFPHGV